MAKKSRSNIEDYKSQKWTPILSIFNMDKKTLMKKFITIDDILNNMILDKSE